MGKDHNIEDFELLSAYLSGDLTKDAATDVEARAETDPEFSDELARMKVLWQAVPLVNTDEAWNKVSAKIDARSGKSSKMWYLSALVAAAIVVLVMVNFVSHLFFNNYDDVKVPVLVAVDDVRSFCLPDGTEVTLNKNSQIAWSSALNVNHQRIVYLKGEAYFDVNHRDAQPFVVKTRNTEVTVLGTKFNVNADETSTRVIVSSGKVKVENVDFSEMVLLKSGQSVLVDHESKELFLNDKEDMNQICWKTKHLDFNRTKLADAIAIIEDAYEVEIFCHEKLSDSLSISATFDEAEVDRILEVISITLNLDVKKTNEQFEIYTKKNN